MSQATQRLTPDQEWNYARQAMAWHGYGSPVGLGVLLVSVGLCALLLRFAVLGF